MKCSSLVIFTILLKSTTVSLDQLFLVVYFPNILLYQNRIGNKNRIGKFRDCEWMIKVNGIHQYYCCITVQEENISMDPYSLRMMRKLRSSLHLRIYNIKWFQRYVFVLTKLFNKDNRIINIYVLLVSLKKIILMWFWCEM